MLSQIHSDLEVIIPRQFSKSIVDLFGLRLFSRNKDKNSELFQYIRKHYGFVPDDLNVYKEALRHSSASFVDKKGHKCSNERLEYLGDAILDAIIAEYLYNEFKGLQEGQLTKMKAKVVSRKNLNNIGKALRIQDHIICKIGKQDLHHSILGNAFEAIVGAIYLDKGYEFTQRITLRILKKYGLHSTVHADVDFKSKLHEWSQKNRKEIEFKVLREKNIQCEDKYHIALYINNERKSEGFGSSKKRAEQDAAKSACKDIFGDND